MHHMFRFSMICVLGVSLLFLGGYGGYADESTGGPKSKEFYNENVLYKYYGFWGNYFVQGDERYKITGFGGSKPLTELLSQAPLAREEVIRYKKKSVTGGIFLLGGLALYFTGLIVYCSSERETSANVAAIGTLIGSLGLTISGSLFAVKSYNHLHKAVWEYNKYILYDK